MQLKPPAHWRLPHADCAGLAAPLLAHSCLLAPAHLPPGCPRHPPHPKKARLRGLRQPSPCLRCPRPAAFAIYARRNYKTPAGHDYYFDPATERIHYLSATGSNNYAIDPMRNTTVGYHSLHELEAKLAAGYTGEADAESDDEADGESAPLSPSKDASHAAQKGCKKSVKGIAGKRVRIAAEGGRGDESPPGGLEAAQTV